MFQAGERNPRWNGGNSEYPNHAEMKRARVEVLQEVDFTCHFCGAQARQIHHLDLTKDNHSRDNLVACCCRCNKKNGNPYNSKYRRLYGYTAGEMAKIFRVSEMTIINWHRKGGEKERGEKC